VRSDTTPAGSRNLPAVWDETRDRITALLHDLPEDNADTAVPTVPGTTIRDALAHLINTSSRVVDNPDDVLRAASSGVSRK
jgi:hypothetical protein